MPERLDVFMARANATYYARNDPFADFATAPEISQAFGEVLGLWAAVCWEMMGQPRPVLLIEAGPGRGTLMTDALRAIRRAAPAFGSAIDLRLIEASPRLRGVQAERLPQARWHDTIEQVPEAPFLLLANEFLDALPIRQFVRRGSEWLERYVEPKGVTDRPAGPAEVPDAWRADPDGTVRETCPAARRFVAALAARSVRHGGFALLIDHGPARSAPGDSLQAIADGRPADPFASPGSRDLTAHVDFAALAEVARAHGAGVFGPIPQGIFLARLGLPQRAHALARSLSPVRAAAMMEGVRRLTEPDQMGRLFKAMAVSHPAMASCPGFESEQAQ
jgi:NADH dehydrogenase [ubiquinone] 1 alpha subcomplex assembly factor 7